MKEVFHYCHACIVVMNVTFNFDWFIIFFLIVTFLVNLFFFSYKDLAQESYLQ